MKTRTVLIISIIVALFASLLCIWFYPSVKDFMASNTMWNGIKKFNNDYKATSLDSLDELPTAPENTVLVSIAYLEYSQQHLEKIKQYVSQGGTLLLMDDFGYGNSILEYLDINARFTNTPLLDPLFCYKNQWFPKISNFNKELENAGINLIVLNHAASLSNPGGNVLAYSSSSSYLDVNGNENKDSGDKEGPFPIAAELNYDKGLIILVSDPSIIISSMIDINDNHAFCDYLLNRSRSSIDTQSEVGWRKRTPKLDRIERRRCRIEKRSTRKILEGIERRSGKNGTGGKAFGTRGSQEIVVAAINADELDKII